MSDPIEQLCKLIAEKLRDEPEISQADLVVYVAGAIAANAELSAVLQFQQPMQQINRDGAKGFQFVAEDGSTIFIEGTHYHLPDPEKFNSAIEAVFQKFSFSKMELDADSRQRYLQSIVDDEDLSEWQECYTPTTLESRKLPPTSKFSSRLKLRVESVKPSEKGASEILNPAQREQVEQLDVLEGLRKYAPKHVLLMGKPGSGKSTSLEWLLWNEANSALKEPTAKIPVFVKLRRCTSTIKALIQDFFGRHQLHLNTSAIEHLLQQGNLLLLLDGLNELPEDFRTEIANFRERYRKSTPMVVSTREQSIGGTLGITKTFKMLPLTEPQMQEFLWGYLGEEGDKLFQQLKGDRLRKFAEIPLLLWMLCRVFAEECIRAEEEQRLPKLPESLGLAFREFTQLYDQKLQEDIPTESRDQWSKLLRHLAFALMHNKEMVEFRLSMPKEEAEDLLTDCLQQEDRTNARECAKKWLQDLLDYHLIQPVMQPNLEEHIEFRHQLIQEYYAAEYFLRLLPDLNDEQLKRDYLNLLKWTDPVVMTLLLASSEDLRLRLARLSMEVHANLAIQLLCSVKPTSLPKMFSAIEQKSTSTPFKYWLSGKVGYVDKYTELLQVATHAENPYRNVAAMGLLEIPPEKRPLHVEKSLRQEGYITVLNFSDCSSKKTLSELLQVQKDRERRMSAREKLFDWKMGGDTLLAYIIKSAWSICSPLSIIVMLKILLKAWKNPYTEKHFDIFKSFRENLEITDDFDFYEQAFEYIKDIERNSKTVFATLIKLLEMDVYDSIEFAKTSMFFYCAVLTQGDTFLKLEDNDGLRELMSQKLIEDLFEKSLNDSRFIEYMLELIENIQSGYRFYNYGIFQGLVPKGKTIRLYFSYASADEALQIQLANHVSPLEQQGIITSWSQRQILPGDEPAQVIAQQLNAADIILLLISSDAMKHCQNEIQWAIERHQAGKACVIPILLRPVDWVGASFSQFDVLPKNHKPVTSWDNKDEAFREIAEGIRAVAMQLRQSKSEK